MYIKQNVTFTPIVFFFMFFFYFSSSQVEIEADDITLGFLIEI